MAAKKPMTEAEIDALPKLQRDWCWSDLVTLVRAVEKHHDIPENVDAKKLRAEWRQPGGLLDGPFI